MSRCIVVCAASAANVMTPFWKPGSKTRLRMPITVSWMRSRAAGAAAIAVAIAASGSRSVRADAPPDLTVILARVGERVADYYKRGQSIVLREKATVLDIRHDFAPDGFSRVTEY